MKAGFKLDKEKFEKAIETYYKMMGWDVNIFEEGRYQRNLWLESALGESRCVRRASLSALRATESVGKKSESLILVRLRGFEPPTS